VFNLLTTGLAGEDAGLALKTRIDYLLAYHRKPSFGLAFGGPIFLLKWSVEKLLKTACAAAKAALAVIDRD